MQDVADEIGASKAHIWDLESGRANNPSIELLRKLASCYNVSVSELIGENPAGKDEEPALVAMYRELKDLPPGDRETIKIMIDRLRRRTDL